jgi:hypothetical protein
MTNKGKGHHGESERHVLQRKGIKTRMNAKGKVEYGYKKDLTKSELLWDKVTPDRLYGLINNKDYEVISISHSTNSFGEFQFITLWNKSANDFVTFYGNGYHWARDRYITDYFSFYSGMRINYPEKHVLFKQSVIDELKNVRELVEEKAKKHKRESNKKSSQFEMIADEIGDEDFAYSETYM